MKIKTAEDVHLLDLKIQNELGIDLKKYRKPEIVENFVDILLFPKYILNWLIRPILISLLIYINGFWVIDLVHIQYFIYAVLGLILFLINGFFVGILFLTFKLKTDIQSILEYSFDILKSCIIDMNKANSLSKNNRKNVLSLLFKGITHIITIPTLSDVISNKVPFIGNIIKRIIKKILVSISLKVQFKNIDTIENNHDENNPSKLIQYYTDAIAITIKSINKVLSVSIKIIQFPIKIIFVIPLSLLILFIYLIW